MTDEELLVSAREECLKLLSSDALHGRIRDMSQGELEQFIAHVVGIIGKPATDSDESGVLPSQRRTPFQSIFDASMASMVAYSDEMRQKSLLQFDKQMQERREFNAMLRDAIQRQIINNIGGDRVRAEQQGQSESGDADSSVVPGSDMSADDGANSGEVQ